MTLDMYELYLVLSFSHVGIVPGPGAHDQTKFLSNKYSFPKFSFGKRLPTSLAQDPYVNTLPPIEY